MSNTINMKNRNKKAFWVALMLSVGQMVRLVCVESGDAMELNCTDLSDDGVVKLRDDMGFLHRLWTEDIVKVTVHQSGVSGHSNVTIQYRTGLR